MGYLYLPFSVIMSYYVFSRYWMADECFGRFDHEREHQHNAGNYGKLEWLQPQSSNAQGESVCHTVHVILLQSMSGVLQACRGSP